MLIDCHQYTGDQIYFLMIQAIIPRPIAWVLSDNGNGTHNLAPFSFFNGITSEPPILMISVGHKSKGSKKDTWVNIEERKEFVVHVSSEELANDVVESSAELPRGESEITKLNLRTEKVEGMRLPRLIGPKVAFFCEKHAIYEIGTEPHALILGEIKKIWFDEAVIQKKKGRLIVDFKKLNPLSRLGGNFYSTLGKIITLKKLD